MTPLGSYIIETLLWLLAICGLAVVALYFGSRAGLGRASGPLELVGRLPLDGRRAVYLVRVGKTVFVVGGSEAGLSKLGEVPAEGFELRVVQAAPRSFRDALARVLNRQSAPGPTNDG
jgi:flagellar biogenesis protein FliO